ncbi:sphingomyelin phosphodiesterase 5-like, partial [Saccoglossus kowalevskii]
MLLGNHYPNIYLKCIGDLSVLLGRKLPLWLLDGFLSYIIPIPPENKTIFFFKSLFIAPLYFCLLLLSLPLKLFLFPVYAITGKYRAPYTYTQSRQTKNKLLQFKKNYTVCCANICSISEMCGRLNNFNHVRTRCTKIGNLVVRSQFADIALSKITINEDDMDSHITTSFPPSIDFFCFQEISDIARSGASSLIGQLSIYFDYFVYNIGGVGWTTYFHVMDSGLLVASRYPILNVQFQPFSHACDGHNLGTFGLVSVKVDLGITENGMNAVGYLATTHLQAYPGSNELHQSQLNEIVSWQHEFQQKCQMDGEIVAFDVLCGDFNFDNMSPGEKISWSHKLFDEYNDYCKVKPGMDKLWTVGTEMRLPMVWDEQVSTPEKLKATLD